VSDAVVIREQRAFLRELLEIDRRRLGAEGDVITFILQHDDEHVLGLCRGMRDTARQQIRRDESNNGGHGDQARDHSAKTLRSLHDVSPSSIWRA
jgi:hypothetical protein